MILIRKSIIYGIFLKTHFALVCPVLYMSGPDLQLLHSN